MHNRNTTIIISLEKLVSVCAVISLVLNVFGFVLRITRKMGKTDALGRPQELVYKFGVKVSNTRCVARSYCF